MKISLMLKYIQDNSLVEFAHYALELNNEWFGAPLDPTWNFSLVWGKENLCARNRFIRGYTILIREDYEYDEQRKAAIAHEIYHRNTILKKGLREILWVDEMLASLVSYHALCKVGLEDYAQMLMHHYQVSEVPIDVLALSKLRRSRLPLLFKQYNYPKGFLAAVTSLGIELEKELDWQDITSIVKCKKWTEWFELLPPPKRQAAEQVLTFVQTVSHS